MAEKDWQDEPVAWFFVLDKARKDNDFQQAAKAQKELERLGVKVKYSKGRANTARNPVSGNLVEQGAPK